MGKLDMKSNKPRLRGINGSFAVIVRTDLPRDQYASTPSHNDSVCASMWRLRGIVIYVYPSYYGEGWYKDTEMQKNWHESWFDRVDAPSPSTDYEDEDEEEE